MDTVFSKEVEVTTEIWLPVPQYDSYYMVSNLGRVKSLDRYVKRSRGGFQISRSKILKQNISGSYLAVVLSKEGKLKTYRVHRLVAMAYAGSIPKDKVINHLDGNKLNNQSCNLEITTQQGNIRHAVSYGLTKGYRKRSLSNGQ